MIPKGKGRQEEKKKDEELKKISTSIKLNVTKKEKREERK